MSVKIMKNSVSLKDETTQTFLPIGMFAAGGDKSLKEFKEFADTTVNEANRQVQRAHDNVDQLTESITSALETGTDTTLTLPGVAADAKVTGDKIGELNEDLTQLSETITDKIIIEKYDNTNITSTQGLAKLSPNNKWVAHIGKAHEEVSIKTIVVADSTTTVKMQIWEEIEGTYSLSKTIEAIEASSIGVGTLTLLTFPLIKLEKNSIITFVDNSANGWLHYRTKTGGNINYFPSTSDSITLDDIITLNNVEPIFYVNATKMIPKTIAVVVDAKGNGKYKSLVDAVENEPSGTTFILKEGTYDGTIRAFNKRVNIIGLNKEKCIIRSTNGLYNNPAMECCVGYFENLTFYAQNINGVSQPVPIGTNGAYAVHCENQNGNDNIAIGDKLIFRNCDMISNFCPAMGVGTFADWSLILDNCRLTFSQPANVGVYGDMGGLGALYIHDMNGLKGVAKIKVKDCIFESTILANTICFYDLNREGARLDFEFINNTIYSNVNGFTDSIWVRGSALGNHFHIDKISHGNTGNVLNMQI